MKSNLKTSTVTGFTLTAMAIMAAAPLAHAAAAAYTTSDLSSRIRHVAAGNKLIEVDGASHSGDASAHVFHTRHLPAAPSRCFSSKNWGMARFSCFVPDRSGKTSPPPGLTLGGGVTYGYTPQTGDDDPPPPNNPPSHPGSSPGSEPDDPPPPSNPPSHPGSSPGYDPVDPPHGGIQPTPEPSYLLITGPALLILGGLAYRRRRQAASQV